MNLNLVLLLCIATVLFSCKKKNESQPDDPKKDRLATIELVSGNNQSGTFGEILNDSLVLRVTHDKKFEYIELRYKMRQGNGQIIDNLINHFSGDQIPDDGYFAIKWRLGCDFEAQEAEIYLYAEERPPYGREEYDRLRPYDSLTVRAKGIKPRGWVKACGYGRVSKLHTRLLNRNGDNNIYMVNEGTAYFSEDEGYNWYPISGLPKWAYISSAQFDNNGWMYVASDEGIYYSKDLETWQSINDGLSRFQFPGLFFIAGNTLLIDYPNSGRLYRRTVHDDLWEKASMSGDAQTIDIVKSHPNGDLYILDSHHNMHVSEDDGQNWKPMNPPVKYWRVMDFAIDNTGVFYVSDFHDRGTSLIIFNPEKEGEVVINDYRRGPNVQPYVENLTSHKDDVLFLLVQSENDGIYSKNLGWNRILTDFTKPIHKFHITPRDQFILMASDKKYVWTNTALYVYR